MKLSELAGWLGVGFLIGIAAHSVWPYAAVDFTWLVGATVAGTLLVIISLTPPLRIRGGREELLIVGSLILSVVFGLYRFELERPFLPRGLVPFSPKGMAYVVSSDKYLAPNDPRRWLGQWRQELTHRAQQIFPPDEAALLTGILYGERGLSKQAKDDFRRAGMLHIIAVSGSNVTIVAVVVMSFLLGFGLSRRFAFGMFSFALVAFVLFVQPSASVVRAAIMGWLIELAPVIGRIPRASRLLLISAVAFTLWKPWSLLFDAGFALSFLAMWGLLTWARWINGRIKKTIRHESLREILSSTVGATLMTTPYTAWAFGQASIYALVTSFLVLPLIPWVMAGGLVALILPNVFVSLPARGGLQAILWIARLPDLIGQGVWTNLSTTFGEMVGWYALIFMIWRLVNRKKPFIHKKPDHSAEKTSEIIDCQTVQTFADD